jgi:hypothetical protein
VWHLYLALPYWITSSAAKHGLVKPVHLIATRIVELAKLGVYDVEELSRRTLTSLRSLG